MSSQICWEKLQLVAVCVNIKVQLVGGFLSKLGFSWWVFVNIRLHLMGGYHEIWFQLVKKKLQLVLVGGKLLEIRV